LAIDAQVSNIYVGDSIFLNGDGFTIKHGGTEVFRADLQGNLKIKGELQAGSIINGEAGSINVGTGGTIQVGNRIKINKDGIIARNQADTAETFRLNANTGEIDIRSGRIRGSVTIGDSDTTMQDVLDGAIGGLDEEDV